jgi:hypothetical protein
MGRRVRRIWKQGGGNVQAGGGVAPATMQKAFREPPGRPFAKKFIQRKVLLYKAGVVPKRIVDL